MTHTVTLQAVVGAIRTSGQASRKRSRKSVGGGRTSGVYAYTTQNGIAIRYTLGAGNFRSEVWTERETKAWDAVIAKLASKGFKVEQIDGNQIVVAA